MIAFLFLNFFLLIPTNDAVFLSQHDTPAGRFRIEMKNNVSGIEKRKVSLPQFVGHLHIGGNILVTVCI